MGGWRWMCGDWVGKGTSKWVETWKDGSVCLVLSDFSRSPAFQCPRVPLRPSQPFLWQWSFCTVALHSALCHLC